MAVTVAEDQTLDQHVTVSKDGTVEFPPLGQLVVEGLTPSEIASEIEERLERDYFAKATVSVKLFESDLAGDFVFIEGEVEKEGPQRWRVGMTIGDVLDLARFKPAWGDPSAIRLTCG